MTVIDRAVVVVFRLAQLWVVFWAVAIVASIVQRLTLFSVVGGAALLLIGGVIVWLAQQMIQDVKRQAR